MNAEVPHMATVDCVEPFLDPEAQQEIRANHMEACRELHERFVGMAKRRGQIDVEEADAIIEAIELQPWREYGITSITAYLEHVMGHGPRQAVERERVARELTKLPDMYQSLKHGLHWSKVRELTRVATPETETAWLDAAQGKNLREVESLVRGHAKGDLPTSPMKPELAKQSRTFEMTDETYALFRQWKAMVSNECGELVDDEHALAAALQHCLAGDTAEGPPTQVAYMICPTCEAATVDGAGMIADVSAETRERVLCDCDDLGDLAAASPERVTASITPRIRRQVMARDHGRCTVPGCRSTFGLQIHHLEHQRDGGTHHVSNAICLCFLHHKFHHDNKLAITCEDGRVIFRRILDHDDAVLDLGCYDLTASVN
jgi:hypothetical protein